MSNDSVNNQSEDIRDGVSDASAEQEVSSSEQDSSTLNSEENLSGLNFQWYVAHALSGYENRVIKTLKERILNYNMSEYFADIIVPEETVITNVNGKKRNIKKKFFPGYVLIKMVMNENTWHLVKDTDKVTGFVGGTRAKPQPISEEEASFMLGQASGDTKRVRSSTTYSSGDSVKVIEGPFASFVGTVESVAANGKLKVNVSIFGRPTPVELDDTQVEKA